MKILVVLIFISGTASAQSHKDLLSSKWKIECRFDENFCSDTDGIWEFSEKEISVTKYHHNSKVIKTKKTRLDGIILTEDKNEILMGPDVRQWYYKIRSETLTLCNIFDECRTFTRFNFR